MQYKLNPASEISLVSGWWRWDERRRYGFLWLHFHTPYHAIVDRVLAARSLHNLHRRSPGGLVLGPSRPHSWRPVGDERSGPSQSIRRPIRRFHSPGGGAPPSPPSPPPPHLFLRTWLVGRERRTHIPRQSMSQWLEIVQQLASHCRRLPVPGWNTCHVTVCLSSRHPAPAAGRGLLRCIERSQFPSNSFSSEGYYRSKRNSKF